MINDLNRYIENTCLAPGATSRDIERLCRECLEFDMRAVVVNPLWIPLARELSDSSNLLVVTVIGFPLGAITPKSKLVEVKEALRLGADELDVVMNLGWACEERWAEVEKELALLVYAAENHHLKVILECGILESEQITQACQIAESVGAWAVKTSTGMGSPGATVEDVRLMRQCVGDRLRVKAAGGIRGYSSTMELIAAGADLIGTSVGAVILNEMKAVTSLTKR